ncbi:MAG: ABC-F family ATP-binding cassette domain-containing protein [Planctomycetota bacterium]
MALITLKGIEKGYGGRILLDGASLVVNEGDRIGLVGPNGTGKSTLLRILAGDEEPEAGERTARRGLKLAHLEQEPHLDPEATVRTAIRAGRGAAEHEIEALAHRLGIDPDAVCGPLSGGERRRVALAQVLIEEPELLLLDEPTNHLDAFITDWLERRLVAMRAPLVMVTHDRYFLDRVATKIIELDRCQLYATEGGYAEFLRIRTARLEAEHKASASRLNRLRRELAWMRRGPQGRGTKAKARQDRFHALDAAAPAVTPDDLELFIPPGPHLGRKVVRLHKVAQRYGDLKDVNLEIGRGERIGIVGRNGAGKTTLLRLCLGLLEPDAGRIETGTTVKFAYVDQARTQLDDSKPLVREIAGENVHVPIGDRRVRIEAFLDRFLFPRAMHGTPVGDLSGGERNRVLLAKLLVQAGNVLALDEPTNDLDLSTLRALEEALVAFPGTVLVVSHDRWFLDRVATRVLHVDDGKVRDHPGDMSSLLDELAEAGPARTRKLRAAQEPRPRKPQQGKLGFNEQRELDGLPDRIAGLEDELAELAGQLADPGFYSGPEERVRDVTRRHRELTGQVTALYTRWEELDAR